MTPSHPDLAHLERQLALHPGRMADASPDARRAAVAVLIRDREGALEVLLIKRAEYASDPWSGHVALPGGRMEAGDATLADTAARETFEEIGIDIRASGVIMGTLDEVHPRTPVLPAVVVRPFVVAVDSGVQPQPSLEVADVFWVPLDRLRAAGAWEDTDIDIRGTARSVSSYRHGAHVVWGLTERVLKSLLQRLETSPLVE